MGDSGSALQGRRRTAPPHVCRMPLILTGQTLLGVLLWHAIPHQDTPLVPTSRLPWLTASPNATQFWTYAPAGQLNNQVIMWARSAVYPLDLNRLPLAPPLFLPKGSGRLNALTVPVSAIFSLQGFKAAGYETRQLRIKGLKGACKERNPPWVVVDSITDARHSIAVDPESVIVEVSNKEESYWSNTYMWFVLDVFIFKRYDAWTEAIRRVTQPSHVIQTCIDSISPTLEVRQQALGVHLRMWSDWNDCETRDRRHPLLIIYGKCNWNGDYLFKNIQRVQQDSQQLVIVATDNREHPAIVELMARLGSRGTFMTVGPQCANAVAVGHSVADIAQRKLLFDAVVEWQGLFGVERFLGSYFSTFSQVIAVHRRMRHAYFIQSHFQAWLAICWAELILVLLVLGTSFVLCILYNFGTYSATQRKHSKVLVLPGAARMQNACEKHNNM